MQTPTFQRRVLELKQKIRETNTENSPLVSTCMGYFRKWQLDLLKSEGALTGNPDNLKIACDYPYLVIYKDGSREDVQDLGNDLKYLEQARQDHEKRYPGKKILIEYMPTTYSAWRFIQEEENKIWDTQN